jgi:hypothetical protein
MKSLSAKKLRKIIIEEIEKLMIQDDALFSRGELTDTGTGTIVGLDVIDDEYDDMYPDYDADQHQCSACGSTHEPAGPCAGGSDEDDFVGYVLANM